MNLSAKILLLPLYIGLYLTLWVLGEVRIDDGFPLPRKDDAK